MVIQDNSEGYMGYIILHTRIWLHIQVFYQRLLLKQVLQLSVFKLAII